MPGSYTPDAEVLTKPADDDWISIAAAELRTLKTFIANNFTKNNSGTAVQIQYTQTGAVATGTTAIPNDDTIPQITEGTEFMTLVITPKSATNILDIEVCLFATEAANTSDAMVVALFRDTTADALAAGACSMSGADIAPTNFYLRHRMVAGGTGAITFRVRAGLNNANTLVFNGGSGTGRKFGGVIPSSIKITEYKP